MRYLISALFISLLFLNGCDDKCQYKTFDTLTNSSKNYWLLKYFSWCGYASSNNINFSLLGSYDSLQDETRIVFVAASRVQSELDKDTTINYQWLNDSTILFTHNKDLQIFRKVHQLGSIHFRYRTK